MSLWAWTLPPQLAAPLAVFGALLGAGRRASSRCAAASISGASRRSSSAARSACRSASSCCTTPTRCAFALAVGALLTLYGALRAGGSRFRARQGAAESAPTPSSASSAASSAGSAASPPRRRRSGRDCAAGNASRGARRSRPSPSSSPSLTLAAYARTGARRTRRPAPVRGGRAGALIASFLGARLVGKGGAQTLGADRAAADAGLRRGAARRRGAKRCGDVERTIASPRPPRLDGRPT